MPSLRSREWSDRCSTSGTDLVHSFYEPALGRSNRYDRAVGSFQSSFYPLTAPAAAAFALTGGQTLGQMHQLQHDGSSAIDVSDVRRVCRCGLGVGLGSHLVGGRLIGL